MGVGLLSVPGAIEPTYALMPAFKFVKMGFIFVGVFAAVHDERDVKAVMRGFAIALILQVVICLWGRYVQGGIPGDGVVRAPEPDGDVVVYDRVPDPGAGDFEGDVAAGRGLVFQRVRIRGSGGAALGFTGFAGGVRGGDGLTVALAVTYFHLQVERVLTQTKNMTTWMMLCAKLSRAEWWPSGVPV